MSEPSSTVWRRNNRARQRPQQAAAARRYHNRYKTLLRKARSGPCASCGGEFHVAAMDLHHRDPASKLFPVAKILAVRLADFPGMTREEVLAAEIAKCDVLCANCHRTLHWREEMDAKALYEPEALAARVVD